VSKSLAADFDSSSASDRNQNGQTTHTDMRNLSALMLSK
jgi:hypothetical protein